MKRLLILFIAMGFLVALPLAHSLQAKPTEIKEKLYRPQICHMGSVITVSVRAVPGHEKHGDYRMDLDDGATCP
jgi:hypothetical protein